MPAHDKLRVVAERAPHIGIVTAYNDMLSAHQPYEGYPGADPRRGAPAGRHRAGGRRRAGDVRRRHAGHCRAWS
jgi:phosphogluconate dehydratase